jgi:hypothetical protein
LRRAAGALQLKYASLLGSDDDDDYEARRGLSPLLQLTLICADVFDVPIQSSMIPLDMYDLAVVDLLGKLDEVLFSKKCVNLSEGLTFSVAVVDAPAEDASHRLAPPIRGGGGGDDDDNLLTCWLPEGAREEEAERVDDDDDDDDDGLFNRDIDLPMDDGDEHNEGRYWLDDDDYGDFSDDDDDERPRCYYVDDEAAEASCDSSDEDDDDDDDDEEDGGGGGGSNARQRRGRKRAPPPPPLFGRRSPSPPPPPPPKKGKRGSPSTKIVVEPDSSVLSLTWSPRESASEEWARREQGLFPLPSFRDDPELNNCCLLTAIVAGLALSQELKEAKSWSQVYHFPKTKAWKAILPWKTKRTVKAGQDLGLMTKRFARLHRLDLRAFKSGNVLEAVNNPSGLLYVPVNFHLYHRTGAEQRFFVHPAKYQPHWPTVHILVLPSDDGKRGGDAYEHFEACREKKVAPQWHAAALIMNPSAYLHKSGGRSCCWCGRAYQRANFASHRCPLPSPRRRCGVCKRPQLLNRDFMSLVEKTDRCDSWLRKKEREAEERRREEEEEEEEEERRRRAAAAAAAAAAVKERRIRGEFACGAKCAGKRPSARPFTASSARKTVTFDAQRAESAPKKIPRTFAVTSIASNVECISSRPRRRERTNATSPRLIPPNLPTT